jgi:multidrug resistance efflux pump
VNKELLHNWYSYACRHLYNIADACLYIKTEAGNSFTLAETTSKEFALSQLVQDNLSSIAKRRKSVVTITSSQESSQQAPSVANAGSATVTNILARAEHNNYFIASPLTINKEVVGVVCFQFNHLKRSQIQDYLSQVEASALWLNCLSDNFSRTSSGHTETVLKSTAIALSHNNSTEAVMALTTELAHQLQCERVSIGFIDKTDVHVAALSNSALHESRQNIVKGIKSVMQEAIDQQETLIYPAEENNYYCVHQHERYVKQYGGQYICTVPLIVNNEVSGAIMFERQGDQKAFDDQTKELCEQLASLIAPILYYRRLNDRPVLRKLTESARGMLKNIVGTSNPGIKFVSVLLILAITFMSVKQWDYKISANAILEGEVERVITSPEEGFIKDATARPGDIVESGTVIATLDDRDLQLENLKWQSKQKQLSKEYREALAKHDLSRIGILRAQLSQAEAQLEILEQKIQRTVITVPLSGVIISGDYTRSLGSPVERGEVLYTVSPLEDYRVVLHIDESEVADITVGMTGELTLSAAAEETYQIEVTQITPVSIAENGINYFKVEASLNSTPDYLRPGMQGVGKINTGQRQLLWIWTHKMYNWLRLKLWSWW